VARDVVGLHERVSAASQDVATGVTRPGADGARAYGAAAIRPGPMRSSVGAVDGEGLGCGPQCSSSFDEVEGAFSGLPHVVAHGKECDRGEILIGFVVFTPGLNTVCKVWASSKDVGFDTGCEV